MNGVMNRTEALKSEGGLASAQLRFDTPQIAAGSFILSDTKILPLMSKNNNFLGGELEQSHDKKLNCY